MSIISVVSLQMITTFSQVCHSRDRVTAPLWEIMWVQRLLTFPRDKLTHHVVFHGS